MYGVEKIVIHYKDDRPPEIIEKGLAAKYIRNGDDLYYWFANIENEADKIAYIRGLNKIFNEIKERGNQNGPSGKPGNESPFKGANGANGQDDRINGALSQHELHGPTESGGNVPNGPQSDDSECQDIRGDETHENGAGGNHSTIGKSQSGSGIK